MEQKTDVPGNELAGYMKNAQGHLVPLSLVSTIDILRDELVRKLASEAEAMQAQLAKLKFDFFAQIDSFVSLSAAEYGVEIGGDKGNLTLMSYDGNFKVVRQVQEKMSFDERLQAAKALVDACVRRWSEGARPEVVVLVQSAFQTDKEGQINTGRVLELRRYPIEDEDWQNAMRAIGDALVVTGSSSYVRVYQRDPKTKKFLPITLDFAGV